MFIGWSRDWPVGLARFLGVATAALLAAALGLGSVLGAGGGTFGDGAFGEDAELAGTVMANPYPVLFLPGGHAVLLAGEGKTGFPAVRGLDGQGVSVRGGMVRRGTLEMLLGGEAPAVTGPGVAPAVAPLGMWRVAGEICDGKCWAGVMRPGAGIAHLACANLCIAGDVPPVFVADRPVAGGRFLLLGDAGGGPLPAAVLGLAGRPVVLQGRLERRGDLPVFLVDLATAARP